MYSLKNRYPFLDLSVITFFTKIISVFKGLRFKLNQSECKNCVNKHEQLLTNMINIKNSDFQCCSNKYRYIHLYLKKNVT